MAGLLSGLNRGAVAPELLEYGDRLDTQLNDPNNFYTMPSENLLLNTVDAQQMAQRGQIAPSEIPVMGLLGSNVKDTATREQALGMDIMNRKRFGNESNKMTLMSPEQFEAKMEGMGQAKTGQPQPSVASTGLQSVTTPTANQLGQGITPEMLQTMKGYDGQLSQPNIGMLNDKISYGRGGREFGQADMGYSTLEAEAMARAVGWDKKTSTTNHKMIGDGVTKLPDGSVMIKGAVYEKETGEQPTLQAGYDENMNVSTPRLVMNPTNTGWKMTKSAPKKKSSGSGKTPHKKTFKLTHRSSTLKDNVVDEMDRNQKFNTLLQGKSETSRQSLKEFSKLAYHKTMLENMDDEDRKQYMIMNDMGTMTYTDLVDQIGNLEKSLKVAGLDVNNELGANMYNDSFKSTMVKYEKHRPIGMDKDVDVTFKDGGRADIDDGYDKRNVPLGYDSAGKGYLKMTFLDASTNEPVDKIFPVDKLTEAKKTEFLNNFSKSGKKYYGTFGTNITKSADMNEAESVSYLGSEKEKNMYNQGMKMFDEFQNKLATAGNMEVAKEMFETYKADVDNEFKDYPEIAQSVSFGAYPFDRDGDGKVDKITDDKKGKLISVLDKQLGREKGFVGKQANAIKDLDGVQKVEIGKIGGTGTPVKYKLTSGNSGVQITIMSNKKKGKTLGNIPTLIPLSFVNKEDINTRAGELIVEYFKSRGQANEDDQIIRPKEVTFLK